MQCFAVQCSAVQVDAGRDEGDAKAADVCVGDDEIRLEYGDGDCGRNARIRSVRRARSTQPLQYSPSAEVNAETRVSM